MSIYLIYVIVCKKNYTLSEECIGFTNMISFYSCKQKEREVWYLRISLLFSSKMLLIGILSELFVDFRNTFYKRQKNYRKIT